MSTKHRKTILKVGTYHSPDGPVEVTPERLQHWSKQTKTLREAGYEIPMHWDHATEQELLEPIEMSVLKEGKQRSAQNTVGKLSEFQVSEDGQSATLTVVGMTDAATEAMSKNTVAVSPVIFPSWKDGANKTYTDAITSIDLVNHPVDHSQGEFVAVEDGEPTLCSIRMGLKEPRIFRLATENAEDTSKDADSRSSGDKLQQTVEALGKLGIVLPPDTTPDNFLDRTLTGLLTAAAQNEDDEDDDMSENNEAPVEKDPAIATMGLDAKRAVAYAEKQHRSSVESRLDALVESGRCTPAELEDQKAGLPAIKLSLDDKGEPEPSQLEHFIASREGVPEGTFWTSDQRAQKMSLVEKQAPTQWAAPSQRTDEEHEAEAQKHLQKLGL